MSEPPVPNEKPPYWDDCKGKTFDQLAEFIEEARGELFKPGADTDLPRSLEAFLDLWEMLREKYRVEGPPSEPLQPHNKLTAKRARRRRLVRHIGQLRNDPTRRNKGKAQEIYETEQKIEALDREIDEIVHSGEYPNPPVYVAKTLKRDPRWRTLWELRADLARTFGSGDDMPTTRFAWRLASPGEASQTSFPKLSDDPPRQNRVVGFDQERLDKVKLLDPIQRYIGIDGFDGYSIYTFEYTSKALMECPKVGNAIFVIGSDLARQWQKMNKQELRTHPSVTWIPHQGNWFQRVKQELGTPDDVPGDSEGPA